MSKVAVVYWSGTGNTEEMAKAVEEGAKNKGADVTMFSAEGFSADKVGDFDRLAFGCPAMGDEELEEEIFEPMFSSVEGALSGKEIALFGSYDWGDGQWMRTWEDRCKKAGAIWSKKASSPTTLPKMQTWLTVRASARQSHNIHVSL